jgi:hypothetical protein
LARNAVLNRSVTVYDSARLDGRKVEYVLAAQVTRLQDVLPESKDVLLDGFKVSDANANAVKLKELKRLELGLGISKRETVAPACKVGSMSPVRF